MELAQRFSIHPAIVAGRVRHETRDFRLLSHFVGTGQYDGASPRPNTISNPNGVARRCQLPNEEFVPVWAAII